MASTSTVSDNRQPSGDTKTPASTLEELDTPIRYTSVDPHPVTEPIVQELQTSPDCCINKIHWITATNPAVDEPTDKRLMVVLSNKDEDSDVLIDLLTNDLGLPFLTQVVRQHFNYRFSIYESWVPEPNEPF